MIAIVVFVIVKRSLGLSWNTILELFLEALLRALVMILVITFLTLSYLMLKARRKASESMPEDQPTRVKSIAFHPKENSWMILALYSGHVVIRKGNDKSFRYAVSPGHAVRACLFSKTDDTWIAASDDNMIRVFHNHDGRLLHEFQAHDDFIRSLDIIVVSSDRHSLLLSSSDDMTVKVWDMEHNYNCVKTLHGHMHYVMQVCTNPHDAGIIATASLDRTIKFWSVDGDEADSSSLLFTLDGHEDGVNSIAFCTNHDNDDDGNGNGNNNPFLVSASDDLTVRLWNYKTRQQLHILRGHGDNVTDVRFLWNRHHHTRDSSVGIVSTSEDCTVRFWYCSTTGSNKNEDEGEAVKTIQYAPLGRGWALATTDLTADVENQVVAIGLDQACMVLNVQGDEANRTISVTKETNVSQHILEFSHVPGAVHLNDQMV